MARLGPYFLPDQPLHVIQRGNNRGAIFFAAEDHARYRDWLTEAGSDYGCAVHGDVLMTNQIGANGVRVDFNCLSRSAANECVRRHQL
jgi:putative transposase